MANPSYTFSWDNFNTTTPLLQYGKVAVDTIFKKNMLLQMLLAKKKTFIGGKTFEVPIVVGKTDVTTYQGFNTFSLGYPEVLTAATYDIAQYVTQISISKEDFDANNGTPKILDLMQMLHENAQASLEERLTTDVISGAGTSRSILGFTTAIASAPTSGTYAGVNRAVYTGWQNQYKDWTSSSIGAFTKYSLQVELAKCSDGADKPDLIVTTDAVFNQIYKTADSNMQQPNELAREIGINSMNFNGIPIIVDKNMTAGHLYILNTKYCYLMVAANNNFALSPWIMQGGGTDAQLAQSRFLTVTLQLVVDNPRRQEVIFGID